VFKSLTVVGDHDGQAVATPDPVIFVSRGPRIWSPKYEAGIAADDAGGARVGVGVGVLRAILTALPPLAVVSLTILAPTGIVICSASTVATGGLVTPAAVETCVIPAISKGMGTAMTTTEWDLTLMATLPSVSLVIAGMRAQESEIGES
jgi:hypothetical protein